MVNLYLFSNTHIFWWQLAKTSNISLFENPNLESAEVVIRTGVSQKRSIILIGHCWVEYIGRARSILEPGDRVLFIKADGSVLIHRPTGYKPVNWQPSKCFFQTSFSDDTLIIKAIRRKVQESLEIFFDKLDQSKIKIRQYPLFVPNIPPFHYSIERLKVKSTPMGWNQSRAHWTRILTWFA